MCLFFPRGGLSDAAIRLRLEVLNASADFVGHGNCAMLLSIDQDERHFAANSIDGVGALEKNVQIDGCLTQSGYHKGRRQNLAKNAWRQEIDLQMNSWQAPATVRDDFTE